MKKSTNAQSKEEMLFPPDYGKPISKLLLYKEENPYKNIDPEEALIY
jgi:hypothetical protein